MKSFKKLTAIILSVIMIFGCVTASAVAADDKELDLVFVVDTTGSMSDDIYEVKTHMKEYVDALVDGGSDYRVAIVEYRDFPERTGDSSDYAYRVTLNFNGDYETINSAINSVDLGNGGDWEETLYSALIDGLDKLSWRDKSGKAAIIMGDAPALDPEPITGYTLADVKAKMLYGVIDDREFDRARASGATRSPITLFTIATSSDSETLESFSALTEATGGKSYTAEDSAEISDIINEIITDELPVIIGGRLSLGEIINKIRDAIVKILQTIMVKSFYFFTFQWGELI